jgi:hypothetical protein
VSSSQLSLIVPPAASSQVSGTPIVPPPWSAPITGSSWFDAVASANVPANGAAAVTVVSLTVPSGYSGVVRKISNVALYGGFLDGSGWLIWQIFIDSATVRNYENITAQLGSTNAPSDTFIEVASGSTVSWMIQSAIQPPPSDAATICRLSGWYWPTSMEG